MGTSPWSGSEGTTSCTHSSPRPQRTPPPGSPPWCPHSRLPPATKGTPLCPERAWLSPTPRELCRAGVGSDQGPRGRGGWGREGGSERTGAGASKGGRDPAPLSITLSPQPSHRIPEPFFRGSQALLADSHKQKGKYLPFYKEKLPLPNKKVISQAVGLDGEAFTHPKEARGPFGCERGQLPASDLGRQEAGGLGHALHAWPASTPGRGPSGSNSAGRLRGAGPLRPRPRVPAALTLVVPACILMSPGPFTPRPPGSSPRSPAGRGLWAAPIPPWAPAGYPDVPWPGRPGRHRGGGAPRLQ